MPCDFYCFSSDPSRTSAVSISFHLSHQSLKMKEKPKLKGLGYKSCSSIIFQNSSLTINSVCTTLMFFTCLLLNAIKGSSHIKSQVYILDFSSLDFSTSLFSDKEKQLKYMCVSKDNYCSCCLKWLKGIQVYSKCH